MTALKMETVDKLILFFCCAAAYLVLPEFGRSVVPFLLAVIFASLLSCFDRERPILVLTAAFLVWSAFSPGLVLFLPVVLYDALFSKCRYVCAFALIPLILFFRLASPEADAAAVIPLTLGVWLRYRTVSLEQMREERNELRDGFTELSTKLKRQNKELLEQQDAEIGIATLNERNRIAREIHDSVGHLLSSSLLQVGALLTVNRDESTRAGLTTLKDTLNEAMNSIRTSVHDLFDESVDLYGQLCTLVKNFSFCDLDFQYKLDTDPGRKLKYAFLAIVKEGLSNIIRHSDATKARISLLEHPAFYQLIISDNGVVRNYDPDSGIGLQNMRDRVDSFHGVINITAENGFRIFITIPKKEANP